jgi:hypothetical protein
MTLTRRALDSHDQPINAFGMGPTIKLASEGLTPTTWNVNNVAGYAPAVLTILIEVGTNDPAIGQLFTFSGHATVYEVTSYSAFSLGLVDHSDGVSGLSDAIIDDEAITFEKMWVPAAAVVGDVTVVRVISTVDAFIHAGAVAEPCYVNEDMPLIADQEVFIRVDGNSNFFSVVEDASAGFIYITEMR